MQSDVSSSSSYSSAVHSDTENEEIDDGEEEKSEYPISTLHVINLLQPVRLRISPSIRRKQRKKKAIIFFPLSLETTDLPLLNTPTNLFLTLPGFSFEATVDEQELRCSCLPPFFNLCHYISLCPVLLNHSKMTTMVKGVYSLHHPLFCHIPKFVSCLFTSLCHILLFVIYSLALFLEITMRWLLLLKRVHSFFSSQFGPAKRVGVRFWILMAIDFDLSVACFVVLYLPVILSNLTLCFFPSNSYQKVVIVKINIANQIVCV